MRMYAVLYSNMQSSMLVKGTCDRLICISQAIKMQMIIYLIARVQVYLIYIFNHMHYANMQMWLIISYSIRNQVKLLFAISDNMAEIV